MSRFTNLFLSALVVIGASVAHAGYDCRTADGSTSLLATAYFWTGIHVDFRSKLVSDYYQRTEKLKIEALR